MAGWPYSINQLTGRAGPLDADGQPDDRWNDCLPASIAAAIEWRFGRHPEPDAIRDAVYGDGHTGYTEPGPMAAYVRAVWGLEARVREAADPWAVIEHALRGHCAVLARTNEGAYYHWTPVTGLDKTTVVRHQVLGGYRETLSRAEWGRRYAGWLLVIG